MFMQQGWCFGRSWNASESVTLERFLLDPEELFPLEVKSLRIKARDYIEDLTDLAH